MRTVPLKVNSSGGPSYRFGCSSTVYSSGSTERGRRTSCKMDVGAGVVDGMVVVVFLQALPRVSNGIDVISQL